MFAAHGRRVPAGLIFALAAIVSLVPGVSQAHAATLYVNAGMDFQAALNAAKPGDEIVLEAGARFVGNFSLPVKPAGAVITIRSSAALPNRRLTTGDASLLPKIASPTVEPALVAFGTSNWRLDGLQFESTRDGMYNIVYLQDATNIYMDRLLIVGGAQGQRRAVMANGRQVTLTRSHIANIWRNGEESQAFAAWDGAGPFTITDNYLEAASEGILFGGANSKSPANIPSDILVEGNHISKRLEWKGQGKVVKNSFELKSAKRAVIRNNLFERNWSDGQNGYAILFTVRNDEGQSPWSVVEDVLFEHNIVRDTENGINILGYDGYQASGRATRITIQHNLVVATGTFLQIGSEVGTVVVDHNTVVQGGSFLSLYFGDVWVAGTSARRPALFAIESLRMTNTLGNHGEYGVYGESSGLGLGALQRLARSYTWTNNVLAGEQGWGQTYPAITLQPSMADHRAQFNTDHSLKTTSSYKNAGTDGRDLGFIWGASSIVQTPVPAPVEVCGDGIDNNGDGRIDEGCPVAPAPQPVPPPAEICGDGIDNNGDGRIDEGCPVAPAPQPVLQPVQDTVAPVVTFTQTMQNQNFYRFRVAATDASGIASVKIWFNGVLIKSVASAPVDAEVNLKNLARGAYPLVIAVSDARGNTTTQNRTVTK